MSYDDYCERCGRSFGDPGYHGTGPSGEEWKKHLDHLFSVEIALKALKEKRQKEENKNA